MTSGIYGFKSRTTNRWYVGQSVNIDYRYSQYKNGQFKKQKRFYNAVKKYGFDDFDFYILLECCPSRVALNYWEKHFIHQMDSFNNGYNLTSGGYSTEFTDDVLNRISDNSKRCWKSESYRNNVLVAINRPEVVKRASETTKQQWRDSAFRSRCIESMRKAHSSSESIELKRKNALLRHGTLYKNFFIFN